VTANRRPLLCLVVCAAPPAVGAGELAGRLSRQGWDVQVVVTPHAAAWVDLNALAERTGYAVRHGERAPGEPKRMRAADAMAVVPATFNTINKWAAGISDNVALGVLNEAVGQRLPIVVAPYAKPVLAAHPAFGESMDRLTRWGVRVLPNEVIRVDRDTFTWEPVLAALTEVRPAAAR
jgi:phosphopantothenoylcysteine synthetase/decarboxylase